MAATDIDAAHNTTTVSIHSESSDGNKYWDVQSTTDESIATIATTPPHTDESNKTSATTPRRQRGLTVTQENMETKEEDTGSSEKGEQEDIDWDFWSRVISDFDNVVKSERPTLSVQIQRGVPPSLRGMIWQLLTKSKDPKLEQKYLELINQESVYEKAIARDLSRTFPNNSYFQSKAGQEALFNVVKAYSLYDSDVGYCQGISFIAGPLLLNMPEEEAFCVLVQLMHKYSLRGHFAHQLDLLHQRLHQFDGLLYDYLPHVHRHFETQGIRSNMYASQWFMTLFAYKFPLDVVFRIYDIILSEGIEALYTFALALVQKNQPTILSLEFDTLVNYLKSDMLTVYDNDATHLIRDAYKIKIPPKRFARLAKEYRLEAARVQNEAQVIENLKKQNKSLTETIRNLEANLTDINKEHALVANELIQSKMEVARIHDENDALRQQSEDLKRALETLPAEIEARVKEEMEILVTKNAALVQRNSALEDQMAYLENMVTEMKHKFEQSESERESLRQRLADLKRLVN